MTTLEAQALIILVADWALSCLDESDRPAVATTASCEIMRRAQRKRGSGTWPAVELETRRSDKDYR